MCTTFHNRPLFAAAIAAFVVASPAAAQEGEASKLIPALLDVSINGIAQDVTALARDREGSIYAPKAAFQAWRLRLPQGGPIAFDGEDYYPLSTLRGVKLSEEAETQRLEIQAEPEAFEASSLSLGGRQTGAAEAESFGAYLNYDLLAERTGRRTSLGGAVEGVLFTPKGVGVATAVARFAGRPRLTRLDTSWTFDSPGRMASLRLGDSFTRGGIGGTPLRFGGIQWTRNFATQPGFLTLPLPALQGSAAAPSVVDVFVNNVLANQQEVAPGPFQLNELPVVTGSGDVRLVVRDALGRESIVTQSYYAAPQLLRKGLHDFSYEAGFLRGGYGASSGGYGPLAASTTHRYGFSDSLTGEIHLEATRRKQVVGLGADLVGGRLGVFSASLAASKAGGASGALAALGFERQANGFSLGLRGELATRRFTNLGFSDGLTAPARTAQAFVGVPTSFGSISANYLLRRERDRTEVQLVGAGASVSLGWMGSLQVSAQRVVTGERQTRLGLFLTRPLGLRRSASSSAEFGSGRRSARAAIQQSLPVGEGFGYRASASDGEFRRLDGWLGYQGPLGLYEAEVTRASGRTGVRVGTSGTIGFMGGDAFAARRLSESFAQVRVDGVEGVRVYANNQLVGRTNKDGIVLVSRLHSYDRNQIRIEPADVPLDFTLAQTEHVVRPYLRSGVVVRFGSEQVAGGIIRIVGADGAPIPAGATVTNLGTNESFVVAPGGEAYVTGLGASNRMRASWGASSCDFLLPFARPKSDEQRLGTYLCKASSSLALAAPAAER